MDGGAFDYDDKYYVHDYDFDGSGVGDKETIIFEFSEARMPIAFSENEKSSIRESLSIGLRCQGSLSLKLRIRKRAMAT